MEQNQRFILGSASPRRLELLRQIGVAPDAVLTADIDETPRKNEQARTLCLRLALEKNTAIRKKYPKESNNFHILTADTVVACGRRLLGKPENEDEAAAFLKMLSGRRHQVWGGIALSHPDGKIAKRVCKSIVSFGMLTPKDIDFYIESHEWQGKAGGYGIQGLAARHVKSISGSYTNIVGLSLFETAQLLKGAGCLPFLNNQKSKLHD